MNGINDQNKQIHPTTRIAILQSCYIPWRGYFDIIRLADIFVIYDDVQYRKNHWHNRNRIRDTAGTQWITIPVSLPFGLQTKIEDVKVDGRFAAKHWKTISQCYAKAAHFGEFETFFKSLFIKASGYERLSEINALFLREISSLLGFNTKFISARDLEIEGERSERLLKICQALGAARYLSGPAARNYLRTDIFSDVGIAVEWIDYNNYRPYLQIHPIFDPAVSIIDLIMNEGTNASSFIGSIKGS